VSFGSRCDHETLNADKLKVVFGKPFHIAFWLAMRAWKSQPLKAFAKFWSLSSVFDTREKHFPIHE
jgi:hypothetical protein